MKLLNASILLFCLILIYSIHDAKGEGNANSTSVKPFQTRREIFARKLGIAWNWIKNKIGPTGNEFLARCAGGFKVLRMVLFAIVFKLGVILTTLGFLTIFSLKGLALLTLLVIMNITGFATKLALFKQDGGHYHSHPYHRGHSGDSGQDIHVHVHSENKESRPSTIIQTVPSENYNKYKYIPSGPYSGWTAKNDININDNNNNIDDERLALFFNRPSSKEEAIDKYLRIKGLSDDPL